MGYNARNNEIRDNITRMRRAWEAERDALATVRRFNARLSGKAYVWFWPKITAAITAKHPWLVVTCPYRKFHPVGTRRRIEWNLR